MLVKQTIKSEIKSAFTEVMNQADDDINAIKSATITYTTGLVTSMGPVTGTFGNTIS